MLNLRSKRIYFIQLLIKLPLMKEIHQLKEASKTSSCTLTLQKIITMCLLMIRLPPINPKRPINLLEQNQPHHLVRERHPRKRQLLIRALQDGVAQAEGAADDEGYLALSICGESIHIIG